MRSRKLLYPEWMLEEIVDKTIIPHIYSIPVTTKILFRCPVCGLEYYQTIHNHISSDNIPKQGCPECGKIKQAASNSLTFKKCRNKYPQWFVDELYLEKDKEKAKNGIIKTSDILSFLCSKCGKEYKQRVANHITLSTGERKNGCPFCNRKKLIENNREKRGIIRPYPQWFIDELYLEKDREYSKHHNFYGYEKKQFYCKKHDLIYTKKVRDRIDLVTHLSKSGCPQCNKENKEYPKSIAKNKTTTFPQWFIDELYLEEDKEKARKGVLRSYDTVSFHCPIHGVFTRKVSEHIVISTGKKKRGCPKCGYNTFYKSLEENRNYPQWFIDELYLEEDKEKARRGALKVSDTVDFVCENGHVYSQIIKSHITLSRQEPNKGCPFCFQSRSKAELEIEEYIKSLGFLTEHICFESSILKRFELDIYIPEKKIGVEYNGSYYHKTLPICSNSKDRMYHNFKYYSCKELGIRLISIFDVDWEEKKEKIKSFLKDLLVSTPCRVGARKCKVEKISKLEANKFYNLYHILGSTTVESVSYGLFYKDELLSCMSFQKGRYKEGKESVWTLTRFVTKSEYVIIGGASKLLKLFEKEYTPSILVSYSDNDYFSGNLYSVLGFSCCGDTKYPRYYWYYKNKELKREQTQLKTLSKKYPLLYKESLSQKGNREDYIMLKLGALKVYRSGNTKWIKKY